MPESTALAALRSALLGDPETLGRIADLRRAEAITALCRYAAGRDIEIGEEALAHALRPDPLGLDRFEPRDVTTLAPPSPAWLPSGIASDGTQMLVDWAHFGSAPFDEPFFEYPLRRARQHPVSQLYRWCTPLGLLADQAPAAAEPVLDGLVLHMSRCGSTLVAQALAAMPGHVVLSEPAPFDAVLQFCVACPDVPLATRIALLRGMVAALAAPRTGPVRRRFLKADCWHAGALPLLRAAFPETPWIFLHRDPRDVLISHERMPGVQALPGLHSAMLGIEDPAALPGLEFTARVLGATCHLAADHAALGGGLFIDYAELPDAFAARILPHFGIVPDAAETDAIAAALVRDAKEPRKPFDPAERAPRDSASAAVIAASDQYLAPAVARLRAIQRSFAD